jgi:hypothetical protein
MSQPLVFSYEQYAGIDPLTIEGIREHVYDTQSLKELLLLTEPSIYPEPTPPCVAEILLGKLGVATYGNRLVEAYQLPEDYVSLGSVLNDVASSNTRRANDYAKGFFFEIGHALHKIVTSTQLIPTELSYKDIIIERDVTNFRILPPVEFIKTDSNRADVELGEVLLDELQDSAGTEQRKALVAQAFEGYWEATRG